MKSVLLFASTFFFVFDSGAQTTAVPDVNFEQALINQGFDTGIPDGSVPTAAIDTATFLNITNLSIADLTGIEDFTALEILHADMNPIGSVDLSGNSALVKIYLSSCSLTNLDLTACPDLEFVSLFWNDLTTLDVSQNTHLETLLIAFNSNLNNLDLSQNPSLELLDISEGSLTTLNVTQNTALTILNCAGNALTELNLDNNTALTTLRCYDNLITSLQLGQQSGLILLTCSSNQLECLNIHNGNNLNLTTFEAYNNPPLTCVEADDPIWADANLTSLDASISFSTDCDNACSTAGLDEDKKQAHIYPNPVNGNVIFLENVSLNASWKIVNAAGEIVLSGLVADGQISVSELEAGIYFLILTTETFIESDVLIIE
jgi:hypothetical protein